MIDMGNLFSTTSDLYLTRELAMKSLEKNQFFNNHFIADLDSKTIVRISMNKISNVGDVETLFKKYWENLSLDFISLLLDEDQISVLVNPIEEWNTESTNRITNEIDIKKYLTSYYITNTSELLTDNPLLEKLLLLMYED